MQTKSTRPAADVAQPRQHSAIIEAIKNREILEFSYGGYGRTVEPQTYGIGVSGRYVLRALQTGGANRSGQTQIAKLFNVAKISMLRKTGKTFEEALLAHNPNDSAMAKVFATLPKPTVKAASG